MEGQGLSNSVVAMTKHHARSAAEMHRTSIRTGFLSSLGSTFLRQIYAAIPSCPSGFGYIWQEEEGSVVGIIACAERIGGIYKQSLLRRGLLMALLLARFIVRPSVMRRIWETLRYPAETSTDLPEAEVPSIAVSPEARGKGTGKALMQAALKEFERRGIRRVKAGVGANLKPANEFYISCGFELALTREHHGHPMNIYVIDLPQEASS